MSAIISTTCRSRPLRGVADHVETVVTLELAVTHEDAYAIEGALCSQSVCVPCFLSALNGIYADHVGHEIQHQQPRSFP